MHQQSTAHSLARVDQPIQPTAVVPAQQADSIVYVPGPGGQFVGVPRSSLPADFFAYAQPTPQQPVAAARQGIDPRAQILAAGGVGVGVAAWGAGQLVSAVAGLGAAGLLAIALLILAARMPKQALVSTKGDIHLHRGAVKARRIHIHQ